MGGFSRNQAIAEGNGCTEEEKSGSEGGVCGICMKGSS